MPNITLAVDKETAREMKLHAEIRWSEVARQAFHVKLRELHALDAAFANSSLTKRDVDRLARVANRRLLKHLREK